MRLLGALVLISLLWTTASVDARTWTVPDEIPTLAAAIDSAGAGDVVELAAGVHQASGLEITFKPNLTIRAAVRRTGERHAKKWAATSSTRSRSTVRVRPTATVRSSSMIAPPRIAVIIPHR